MVIIILIYSVGSFVRGVALGPTVEEENLLYLSSCLVNNNEILGKANIKPRLKSLIRTKSPHVL